MILTNLFAPLLLSAPCVAPTESVDRLWSAVPEDAWVAVATGSFDDWRKRWDAHAFGALLRDAQVQPLFKLAGQRLGALLEDARADLPEDRRDLADPEAWFGALHGGLAAFLTTVDGSSAVGLVVELPRSSDELRSRFGRALDLWSRQADTLSSTRAYEGVSLRQFEARELAASDPLPDGAVYFEAADMACLIASDSVDAASKLAEGTLDRLAGRSSSDSLSTSRALREARGTGAAANGFELFVDVGALLRALDARTRQESAEFGLGRSAAAERVQQRLGLDKIRYLHAAASLGEGESADFEIALELPRGSLLSTLGGLVGPRPEALLARMPSNCNAVQLGRVDLQGAWTAVQEMLRDADPHSYNDLRNSIEGMAQMTGLDFEKQLLAQLTGEFGSFQLPVPAAELSPIEAKLASSGVGQGSAAVIGLEDVDAFQAGLEQALEMAGLASAVQSEQFHGRWIHELELGQQRVQWFFADNFAFVSAHPSALRGAIKVLEGKDPGAVGVDRFAQLLRDYPRAGIVSAMESASFVSGLLALPQIASQALELAAASDPSMDAFASELRELPWPDPSVAARYFHGSIRSVVEGSPTRLALRVELR